MKALIPILAATAALTLPGAVTQAGQPEFGPPRSEVTSGRFHTLPGGASLGYDITGTAKMVRVGPADGHTVVIVRLRGLDPDGSYPTHVHNRPCSATPAGGGHYQQEVGGAVNPHNEIWPTVTTNRHGNGFGRAVHEWRARAEAQSVVVHYPPDTSIRLACVDLQ